MAGTGGEGHLVRGFSISFNETTWRTTYACVWGQHRMAVTRNRKTEWMQWSIWTACFWVFKWAGLPLIPHFQGQNWLWTWQRPSQGVACKLNTKQGEQSLQTHSAKEPEGAPVSLKSLPTAGLQAHETLDKIVSGCESRLVNLTNHAIRSLGLFAFPFVFWLSFISILWKWNGL